ncbi:MAG: hypothetical protein EAY65_00230 [Alphaproteobacteria bacterium]|nr:MAG: hypothetical protein EAY65_00230 [Alphaproteobacteria bacterium]
MTITISTFYVFTAIDPNQLITEKAWLLDVMKQHHILGTILLAHEGLNATICGEDAPLEACIAAIKARYDCDFRQTLSTHESYPFHKAKVRIKPTLVKLGAEIHDAEQVGTYLSPREWNELLQQDDVVLLDTRNVYETHLGTFKGAIDPNTRKFNHLPAYTLEHLAHAKDKKLATFCTGGIRCEKYTAWLKEQGFTQVYHLEGGILRYLHEIPEEESLWEGSCYVFDDRVAVKHGHAVDREASNCPNCGHTLTAKDLTSEHYVHGVRCRHCDSYPPSNYDLLEQGTTH